MFGLDNLIDLLFDAAVESMSRNETVIKLLKQLKLDPDHPPADFTGVYQYALVEYGVGKPKPVLEIFRQPEIQQLFREALAQNNPARLLQQGEAFLTEHPLGTDIQRNQVDVRREFYEFAAVFIEVAKRTRTPAEILAQQKLESLHRQIGTLQERLNRLPTLEGMRTEMARLAAREYPALPGSEIFDAEQCKAFAMAQQMRGWFETLGFRLESHEVWQDDCFEWIINIPVRRGRYDRILVRGIDGEAGLSDVELLRQSVETHRTDEGWLVTARRISRAARDEIEKAENDGLGCYTFDELLDQDADFSGYLTWLEAEIQQRGIDQNYVPLACIKEEIDPDTHQRMGVSRYDERDGWIDGYLDLWLDDPAKEHISVLGEFGTGKTWFAFHYAWKALQRYSEAKQRGLERPRLPLVVPLRDYAKAVSVESLFSEFFFRKHEIPIPGYSAFEQLNRMGKLLLIFDGFDEMAARVDRQQMINNFWELAKVVVPGAKVILTCRTEHFPEAKEGRALLNAELQASTKDLTGETPQFEVLELEKFNDEQIRQVLSHQAQPATVEQIMGNPQLLDLARRPVLTELILEALPDIEAGKPVDMSRVYLYAVRHKMERDIKAERTFTSMADKLYFMCELSWEMLSTDRMSINYREFPERIRKLFGSAVEEQKDLDHWHYDMMGQTMLIRNAEGDYTPAHRSLIEFFVAYKFAAELGALSSDFLEIAQMHSYSAFNTKPKMYTWSSFLQERIDRNRSEQVLPIKDFESDSLEHLCQTFGKSPLTKAVLDFMLPLLNSNTVILQDRFIQILQSTQNKKESEVAYTGGNAATLLIKKDITALENKNLSNAVIIGGDFTKASLRFLNLQEAYLRDSTFMKNLDEVWSVSLSPDSKILAAGESNGIVSLWDFQTGKELLRHEKHKNSVRALAFSPNGELLASASNDLQLWNVETGETLASLQENLIFGSSIIFSPDGENLLFSCESRLIKVLNVRTQKVANHIIKSNINIERPICFSLDGEMVAISLCNHSVSIWSFPDINLLSKLEDRNGRITSICFDPTGNTLAIASNSVVELWNIKTGTQIKTLKGHKSTVSSVAFNSQGSFLASGSGDHIVKIWDVNTGVCIGNLIGHDRQVTSLAFDPKAELLVSGSIDSTIRVWNTNTKECCQILKGHSVLFYSIDFSPKEESIVSGSNDHIVRLWDVRTGKCIKVFQGHTDWIYSVAFDSSGKLIASGSYDRTIRIWNVHIGQCISILYSSTDRFESVTFSCDGKELASGGLDCIVRLWDLGAGKSIKDLIGHSGVVHSVAYSPDGQIIASGSRDRSIKLWDREGGKCIQTLRGHKAPVWSVALSPDGTLVASCSPDQTVRIWDVQTGECLNVFEGHKRRVRSVTFSPNGKELASSDDVVVKRWKVDSGQNLDTLEGHTPHVGSVVYGNNGQTLASGSWDGTIKLWNIETGKCLKTMEPKFYEGMNIKGVKGLTEAEKASLKALGAIGE